jgi:Ca2+-binding EF-hand superfamily protein
MADSNSNATPTPSATPDANEEELKSKVIALVCKNHGGSYKNAFDHYDKNQDQKIDEKELKQLLEDANVGNWVTRGKWVDGLMKKFDSDHDRCISWGEFSSAFSHDPQCPK